VKHYSEEDLILHFYGEDAGRRRREISQHVDECASCADVYRELAGTLQLLEAPEAPERGEQYGLEVWQRIRARLPEPEAPWWVRWLKWDRLAVAGAIAMLVVVAFITGLSWSNPGNPSPASPPAVASTIASDGRQRILLTSVTEHLDRSERILTDIMNAPDGGDISTEQRRAEDLVSTSRLYRQEAVEAGEQSVASVLEDLERNLLEVIHSPSKVTAADLDDVRQRIDAASLLFKVRVMSDELRQREQPPAPSSPRTSTRKVS